MPRSFLTIFVSATSRDLRSYRQAAAGILSKKKMVPIVQEQFGVDHRRLRELLRDEIGKCDAVICLVGHAFGTAVPGSGHPPRSYTQAEYDMAVELGKPVYVFLASEQCLLDQTPADDPAGAMSQWQHRQVLLAGTHKCEQFASQSDLEKLVALIDLRCPWYRRAWGIAAGVCQLGLGATLRSVGILESGVVELSTAGSAARGLLAWGELRTAQLLLDDAWQALRAGRGRDAVGGFLRTKQLLKSVEPKLGNSPQLRSLVEDPRVQEFHRLLGFEFLRLAEVRRLEDERLSRFAWQVPHQLLDPDEGTAATMADEYQAAIGHFEELLRIDPNHIEARFGRAWCTILGSAPRDLSSLQGLVNDLGPMLRTDGARFCAESQFATAEAFRLHGQSEQAIGYYTAALAQAEDWGECWFRRGEMRSALGRYAEAIDDLSSGERSGYRTADIYLRRGDALRLQALPDPHAAAADYRQAARIAPGQYNGHFGLAMALLELIRQLPPDHAQPRKDCLTEASTALSAAAAQLPATSSKLIEVYRWLRAVEAERGNVSAVEACRQKLEELQATLCPGASPCVGLSRFHDLWPTVRLAIQDRLPGLEDRLAEFQQHTLEDVDNWLMEEPQNQHAHYGKGLLLYKHGRWAEAVDWFSRTIPLTSEPGEVYFARALSRAQPGDWHGCLDDCAQALKRTIPFAKAWCLKGTAHARLQELEPAKDCFDRACELDPTLADAQYSRLWVLAQQKKWGELASSADAAVAAGVRTAPIYTARAEAYRQSTQPDGLERAAADCAAALAIDPRYPDALRLRGQILLQQVRYDQAAAHFDHALTLIPDDAWLYCYRAGARRMLRQFEQALADTARAIELSDHCKLAYYDRGWTHLDRQLDSSSDADLADAETAFRRLVELEPGLPAGHTGLAETARRRRQTDEALRHLVDALVRAPADAMAHQVRGWINYDRGDWGAAQLDFSRALESEPANAVSCYGRAECERMQRRWDEAHWDYSKAIELNPQHGWARLMRGHVRHELQDFAGALQDFADGAAIANPQGPQLVDLLRGRAGCRFELGEDEAALTDCGLAAEYQPDQPDTYVTWSAILHNLGRSREAIAMLNRALSLNPRHAQGYETRSIAHSVLGDFEQAIADADCAVEINPQNASALDARAWARNRGGRFAESIPDCDAGIRIDPTYPFLYCNLALARLGTGQRSAAVSAIQAMIAAELKNFTLSHPRRTRANMIGWRFTIDDWHAACGRHANDPLALAARGACRWFAGELESAVHDLEAALERDADLGDAVDRALVLAQRERELNSGDRMIAGRG